jgi:hypothetical protein
MLYFGVHYLPHLLVEQQALVALALFHQKIACAEQAI